MDDEVIMRPKATSAMVGLGDRQLRNLEAEGKFPKRFALNPPDGRAVGHLRSEVLEWVRERAAAREATRK